MRIQMSGNKFLNVDRHRYKLESLLNTKYSTSPLYTMDSNLSPLYIQRDSNLSPLYTKYALDYYVYPMQEIPGLSSYAYTNVRKQIFKCRSS